MLLDKINNEIKKAMLDKYTNKRDALRAVKSRANLLAKDSHSEITDDIVVTAINKELKELKQGLSSLNNHEDDPLYKTYKERVSLLEEYLPEMMSEEDLRKAIGDILNKLGDVPFGKKMQAVMGELKGKADGKLIQSIVKSY